MYRFDVLHLAGHDTTALALRARKRLLRRAVAFRGPVRLTPHRTGDGEAVDEDHSAPVDEIRVKSPMNSPRAAATHVAAISQNRMITVVSGQPTSSKW